MKNVFKSVLESMLKNLSRKVLSKSNVEIIGITGSVGKSSAKEAIYKILNDSKEYHGKVKKSEGNLNNEIGLPLSILGFSKSPSFFTWPLVILKAFFRANFNNLNPISNTRLLVLEYASDKPGDIQYLTSIARPKVAVLTYVGEAHMEFFDSIDKIALEKSQLVKSLPKDGVAIINSDNDYAWRIGLGARTKVIYFGTDEKSKITAKNINILNNKTEFTLKYENKEKTICIKAIGKQQVYAAMSAIGVGLTYNLDFDSMIQSLNNYSPLSGRDNIVKGINNSLVFDSSYNANLTSTKAALQTLKELKTSGRKIAVLGDMRELGKITKDAHKEIAIYAKQVADKVVLVGQSYKDMPANKWFVNSQEAADFIKDKIENNDIILVKGSHAMEMEKIVNALSTKKVN
jgi:UDP-N-acetylmuramoyl-tripeptide--D-alanyl-D-alanine ligase